MESQVSRLLLIADRNSDDHQLCCDDASLIENTAILFDAEQRDNPLAYKTLLYWKTPVQGVK